MPIRAGGTDLGAMNPSDDPLEPDPLEPEARLSAFLRGGLRNTLLAIALLLPSLGGGLSAQGPAQAEGLFARIHTHRGQIVVRLEPQRTPLATSAFVGLAEGTIENAAFPVGRPYYDGTPFHRVVPGHVIQAGAPDTDRADGPGWMYPNEIHVDLGHGKAGMLGVANSGPHTNSGQFYITLGDRSYLDGDYIVFGEVAEGMQLVEATEQGDVVDSIRVVRVGAEAEAFHPDTESFRELVRRAEARLAADEDARKRALEQWLEENLEDALTAPGEVAWPEADPPPGQRWVRYRGVALRYLGHLLGPDGPPVVETRFGSGEEGMPGFFEPRRAFAYPAASDNLPPGLDEVVGGLAPDETRIVVVPPEKGYGPGGFYGPQRAGEARFVIHPNVILAYAVETAPERRPRQAPERSER